MGQTPIPNAADLRAALARRQPRLPLYQLAARASLNPTTLSRLLNEHAPLSHAMAERILRAIADGATTERPERATG